MSTDLRHMFISFHSNHNCHNHRHQRDPLAKKASILQPIVYADHRVTRSPLLSNSCRSLKNAHSKRKPKCVTDEQSAKLCSHSHSHVPVTMGHFCVFLCLSILCAITAITASEQHALHPHALVQAHPLFW